jgi:hypothetical protein
MAQSALAHRVQLGAHVLATFIASNEALHQQLTALAPQAWEALCYHPARLMPVHLLVEHRITEVAMHGWDIRAPSDPSFHLAPESFPAFLTIIVERVVTRAFRPDARRARPIGYRFVATGPLTTTTDILLSADGARVVPTGHAEVDVCFRCEAEPYILVMFGQRPLEAAIATGEVTVAGDHALATAFGQSFQGG